MGSEKIKRIDGGRESKIGMWEKGIGRRRKKFDGGENKKDLAGNVESGCRSVDQFLRFKIDRFKIDMDAGP